MYDGIEIEAISKSFYKKEALNNISMNVKEGEIFGLLGENGAGKTTLLRIINQIILADNGTIRIRGELMNREHLHRIGYMPEERGLYQSMTVEEHAFFLGKLRGLSKKNIQKNFNKYLEKFAISDWKKKRIETLSKGMAQKVQFICTVLHHPDFIFLDEPYSGFDPINIELIKNELIEMRKDGKIIVLSTHNMKSVEEICDRVALIHRSKKLVEDLVTNLRQQQKKDIYSVRFRGNMIAFSTALWTGFEVVEANNIQDDLFEVIIRMRKNNTFNDLLNTIVGKVTIEAAWEILPSMQDVFINIVEEKNKVKE